VPIQDADYHRRWRAERSARSKMNSQPKDLPGGAECKTCANLPGRRAHSCLATQWLLDEPVCDDCAEGAYHYGYAPRIEKVGSAGYAQRKVVA
jgi:hypothetical protein